MEGLWASSQSVRTLGKSRVILLAPPRIDRCRDRRPLSALPGRHDGAAGPGARRLAHRDPGRSPGRTPPGAGRPALSTFATPLRRPGWLLARAPRLVST